MQAKQQNTRVQSFPENVLDTEKQFLTVESDEEKNLLRCFVRF